MNRRRIGQVLALVVAVAIVVVWQVTGEEDPFETYCAEVKDNQSALGREVAQGGKGAGLINALPTFEVLAAKAPEDISDDWEIVIARLSVLEEAIVDAGADPKTYRRDDPPAAVDATERRTIDVAARELASTSSQKAFASVAQHARDVCQTPLYIQG